jgi:mitochondrial import receptor subunit TOM40
MLGRIGTEGDFHGVINNPLNSWIGLRLSHQRGPREHPDSVTSFEADFTGDDNSTCAKLQFHNQSPALTLSYNQSITPSLSLGCEGQLNIGGGLSALSTAFSFTRENNVISGQLMKQPMGPLSGHVNFLRKVDTRPGSNISYATQLKFSPDPKTHAYKTEWCVGWDYKLQLSSVKGHIDSNGKVAALLEQRMTPFMSLILSGMADLWNHKYTFGLGLQVVLQELTEEQQRMMMAEEQRLREKSAKKESSSPSDDEFKIPDKDSKKQMF